MNHKSSTRFKRQRRVPYLGMKIIRMLRKYLYQISSCTSRVALIEGQLSWQLVGHEGMYTYIKGEELCYFSRFASSFQYCCHWINTSGPQKTKFLLLPTHALTQASFPSTRTAYHRTWISLRSSRARLAVVARAGTRATRREVAKTTSIKVSLRYSHCCRFSIWQLTSVVHGRSRWPDREEDWAYLLPRAKREDHRRRSRTIWESYGVVLLFCQTVRIRANCVL